MSNKSSYLRSLFNLKDSVPFSLEPILEESEIFHSKVITDLNEFKQHSDVIVANRLSNDITDVESKVYTRDLLGKD